MSVASVVAVCVPLVEPLGYDIVDVETSPKGQVLRIFIDRLDRTPVTLDDCSTVSNAVQDALDAAGVSYERLEVSSPGVDRALTRPVHFQRFVGHTVTLRLTVAQAGRTLVESPLLAASETGCEVEIDGVATQVGYDKIKRARIKGVLNWNGLEKE